MRSFIRVLTKSIGTTLTALGIIAGVLSCIAVIIGSFIFLVGTTTNALLWAFPILPFPLVLVGSFILWGIFACVLIATTLEEVNK